MDQNRLREYALQLERVAAHYAACDPEAALFYDAAKPWWSKAKAGLIPEPLEAGELHFSRFYFTEGNLRKYRDLESAWAAFAVEARGLTDLLRVVERVLAKNKQ